MSKKSSKPEKKAKDVIGPQIIRFENPRDRFIMALDLE